MNEEKQEDLKIDNFKNMKFRSALENLLEHKFLYESSEQEGQTHIYHALHTKIRLDIEFQTDMSTNADFTAKHRFGRAWRYYHRRRDKKPRIYPWWSMRTMIDGSA